MRIRGEKSLSCKDAKAQRKTSRKEYGPPMNADKTSGTAKFAIVVATWFGCGYAPKAPGTAGSLAALGIGIVLHEYAGFAWWHFLVLAAVVFVPATWAATVTAEVKQLKDPQIVVVDEVLGQWIALAGVGARAAYNWKSYLAALALFRLFDIWKPPPWDGLEAKLR